MELNKGKAECREKEHNRTLSYCIWVSKDRWGGVLWTHPIDPPFKGIQRQIQRFDGGGGGGEHAPSAPLIPICIWYHMCTNCNVHNIKQENVMEIGHQVM